MFRLANRHRVRRSTLALATGALVALGMSAHADSPALAKLGRPATPAEIKAWDIDVRPDFTGLPPGAGSVARGQEVWESRCENCHGAFGESNEVFTPIIGGTTAEDVKTGHVASLRTDTVPQRTTLMKVSELSVLWDYINRAMPWNQPKSLSTDDVYAVVAYILNLGGVVPSDYVLSDKNMQATQNRLPNRNGINAAFMSMAIASGMTSAITNPLHTEIMTAIMGADVLMGHDQDCMRWIRKFREVPPAGADGTEARGRRETRRRRVEA